MTQQQDEAAWHALADSLADAAEIHVSAADRAEDPALKDRLSSRAGRLRLLVSKVQGRTGDPDPGTGFHLLDEFKLLVDSWLGDDDAAARTASREAKANLVALLDDHLRDPELSPETLAAFADIRAQITGAPTPAGDEAGLRALPN